jgi:ribosomal protein S21
MVFVTVTDNDIAKALKALKYNLQRQGVFKELRDPSLLRKAL